MPKTAEGKLRLKAIDNMSRVIDGIKNKMPGMTRSVRKASTSFKLLQRRSEGFTKSAKKMGRSMQNIGKKATVGLTAPIGAFGALAVRTGINFEKSMNKVSALTGESGDALKAMRKEAKKLGSETAFSASQAADAMAFFGQAGWDANEIIAGTGPTLALAAASGTELAQSADILSNIMGGFGKKAEQANEIAGKLALTTAKGNVNLEMLGETFKDAGPVAFAAGNRFETVAALTAKLGDAGIQGSKAGTTLKQMFSQLAGPTTRIKKIMGELGVKSVDPATGKLRDMGEILVDLNKSFQAKGIKGAKKLAVLNEIFGKRAVAGADVLLNAVGKIDAKTGLNSVQKLVGLLDKDGPKAAKKMAKTMMKGLGGAFTQLGSAFEGVQLAILDLDFGGKKLGDRIVEIVTKLTKFLQGLSTTNKTMLKWIVIIGGVLAVIGPFVGILGTILFMVPSMVTGFNMLVAVLGALKVALAAAAIPAAILMAKFLLVAGAAYLIYKNWKPIKAFFVDLFTDPLQQIKDMVKWIGKISGISSLFGLGDDTDEKLRAQGFKLPDEGGAPTKATQAIKDSSERKKREKKGVLDVNFSNVPKDTVIMLDDRESIVDNLTGAAG